MKKATMLCLTVLLIACTRTPKQALTNDEIDLFQEKLAGGATPQQACNELHVLCEATGFGCKAHAVFCDVPTREYICQQLSAACITYPAACDVFSDHCEDLPQEDSGPGEAVPVPDAGAGSDLLHDLPSLDQFAGDSSPKDQGVMTCQGSDQVLLDTSAERIDVLLESWSCMTGCQESAPANVIPCLYGCLEQQTGLTSDCAHCVSKTIECQFEHCLNECSNLESADCRSCSWNSGCDEFFHVCTGVPPW